MEMIECVIYTGMVLSIYSIVKYSHEGISHLSSMVRSVLVMAGMCFIRNLLVLVR